MNLPHRPVMRAEVLAALAPFSGGFYVDGTLGAGGHASAILEASSPAGRLLGLDRDPEALALAARNLSPHGDRFSSAQAGFAEMESKLAERGEGKADGILLDLGVSSMQLDQARRGFSFRQDGPLDMRMGDEGPDAASLVNSLEERELARAIASLGEDPMARRIARAIVAARQEAPITSTARLAAIVEAALPAAVRRTRSIHPATQTFQALRILVNNELEQLDSFLEQLPRLLKAGGRVAIISYHSLEDRRVKQALRALAHPCTCPPRLPSCVCGRRPLLDLPQAKAVKPGPEEIAGNPRSRSARLRWAVRTEDAA